jgi:tRNA pseudouridine13 synthase
LIRHSDFVIRHWILPMPLPYLTSTFPGIGGVIKQRPEDFFVQEMPLYEPSGEGEHVYCEIQKIGMTTFEAIHRISAALGVSSRDIGYAGLKDARAITRQLFSIRGTTPQAVMDLKLPDITAQWAARHGNKLRLGHLAGNRFAIKIRDVNPTDVVKLKPVIAMIQKRGMPNYFGQQRFGRRNNNDRLGAALVRGDDAKLLSLLLGMPDPALDDADSVAARRAFDEGKLEESMKRWPNHSRMEMRVLSRLIKTGNPAAAVGTIDEKIRKLYVSALQSRLFNDVLARRMETLDRLLPGDLAWKHENGACFKVVDVTLEQPRCDAFEISPTGPLIGYRMTLPESEALAVETEVFACHGLSSGEFRQEGREQAKGARRPLRVKPADFELAAGVDEHGGYVTTAFTLPPGSFATTLLRELMKVDLD